MNRIAQSLRTCLTIVLLCAAPLASATAQGTAGGAAAVAGGAPGAQVSEAELRALAATLEDAASRKKLIAQLNALAAARQAASRQAARGAGAQVLDGLSRRIHRLSRELVAGARVLVDAPRLARWLEAQFTEPQTRRAWFETVWKVVLAILAGLAGELITRRLLARPRRALEARDSDSLWLRVPVLLARTVVDVVPIAGFFAVGLAALTLVEPDQVTRLVTLALINASVIARAVIAVARMMVVPAVSGLRVLPISDVNANYIFFWIRRLTNVTVYGYFLAEAAEGLGMPAAGADALLKAVGLVVALMVIVLVLQNRAAAASWLRGDVEGAAAIAVLRARLADIWHVLAILYVIAIYAVWVVEVEGGFEYVLVASVLSVVILVVARVIAGAFGHAVRRGFALRADVRRRFPGLEARAVLYVPVLRRVGVTVIYVVAAFALLEAWGVDSVGWLGTDFGQRLAGSALTIAGLVVAAVLLWETASSAIERYLEGDGQGGAPVSARARTLLPLLRTTILVVLVTLMVLVVLSELGVNIAPLLAGAGVVGLAVGIGSQALVKDIITGVFILMENQFAVGDVIRVGTHAGLVEDITLRTIRMRDFGGIVHIVPFGEVASVENMTKDFSRYVFDVGVAYREDTDQVVEVLHEIGAEMAADPAFADLIVAPLEVMGVDAFEDSAVVIKARITTRPIKQWDVGREFNRRMKKRFDELGIEIPFPHQTVYFGEDKMGAAPPAHVRVSQPADHARAPAKAAKPAAPSPVNTPRAAARGEAGHSEDGDAGDGM